MSRKTKAYKTRYDIQHIFKKGIIYIIPIITLFFILIVDNVGGTTWPTPGNWPVWGSQSSDITPVAWPAEGAWRSYTAKGSDLADPSVADPSNGGTSPQNYVSVTSNCPDKTLPSVYWAFDAVNHVIFFRFRLSAIPNTYATGPSAGSASTTDPWRSAQWSVLIDIDGDGYREFAVQLDGSTGGPSTPVDRLSIIYSATQSNSLDYATAGTGIYLVNQFPTAYVNSSGGTILNFHSTNSPDTTWANGSAETVWDYGMTRSRNITVGSCTEYITDYQIPISQLDATSVGGPKLSVGSPMSFLFATANSLQNPFQKDVVTTGDTVYIGDPTKPGPFGDTITPDGGGSLPQAVVASVSASGCGPVSLSATVNDAIDIVGGNAVTTVASVDFYYYEDTNGDGLDNDSNTWTLIGSGSTANNPIGLWTASWNSSTLSQGRYLIGAKATNGQGNITWSWIDPADIGTIGTTPPNYANPTSTGVIYGIFTNTCGAPPPYATKTSNASSPVSPGAAVIFTITIYNTNSSAITVSSISDSLPAGFTYQSTGAGTIGAASTSPNSGDSGTITWTFAPASIPASSNRTLIFTCNASATSGTYSNTASVTSSVGTLDTDPTQVSVGSPQLTITKIASVATAAPGDSFTYTIGYANTSPVNVTGVTISDPLPDGVTYVSNTGGGTYTAGTRTVSWNIGNLAAGDSGSVTVTVNVDNPFSSSAAIPVVNTVSLASNEASTATASTSVYVSAPRPALSVQKSASSATISANNNVTFTISYTNTGNSTATSLTLTDPIPSGLTFVSATGGGTNSGGTVTWNLPDLAPNTSGSVTVTLNVPLAYAGSNPITNTVTLSATGITPVTNSFWLGVTQTSNTCNTYYFTNTTGNVGADGTQYMASTTTPTGAGTNLLKTLPSYPSTPVPFTEIARFYSPATTNNIDFSGNLTTTYWVDRANGNAIDVKATVYDYDSVSGTKTELGTNTVALGGNAKGMQTFTVALSGTLLKEHHLLWIIEGAEQQKSKTDDIYFQFGGTVTNPISGGTVNAISNGAVCFTPPANLVLDKQVNVMNAGPGDTLTYTILFSNTGQTAATGAQVTDTLPTGVTYVSATLNGSATSPASSSGQDYVFNVNSSDTGTVGRVSGGQSGTLIITATVNSPLADGITTLENSATLESNETSSVTDTTLTGALRPDVSVSKSVNRTLVEPGDLVTYTFTIINSGTGSATNVTLTDTLPVQAYYTYVSGSTTLNGATVADNVSGATLSYNIGTLAGGAVAVVTLRMQAGAAGVFPATQTNLSNTASVSDSQTSGTRSSNTVTVTINPLPNLSISKSFSPSGPYTAGDTVTCEISVSNNGGSDATGVMVRDDIPSYTTYASGTLEYEGASKTDTSGDDAGSYDAAGNRVIFNVGTLSSGSTRTMSFNVNIQHPMSSGSTILTNTAEVTASNAASKTDTATETINAEPGLNVVKIGPSNSPYPAATATATSSGTSVQVDDVSPFMVNQYIRVNGQNRQISSISGSTLTVASSVNVTNGDSVIGSFTYSLQYSNTGSSNATGAQLVDTLPAGAIYVTSTGSGSYNSGANTVTWSIGSLPVDSSGLVQVTIFPGAAGNLTNSAVLTATGADPATDSVVTGVGGLRISKRTTTATVGQGGTPVYIIDVENNSPSTATGVVVTDTLPPGFTYASTGSITGATRTSTSDPSVGDEAPSWGTFSINSGSTMTITFTASVETGIVGTFDNEVSVTSTNTSVGTFDPLSTTAEDVTVSASVIPAPTGSLTNSTGDISVGCSATLNWTASNAATGLLTPGNISIPVGDGSGSVTVSPTTTTTYTLTLTGAGGSAEYTASVTVNAAPNITAFSVTPTSIAAGESVTFSATFTGGTGVITPGNHSITSGGTYVLNPGPSSTTTYTLTVTAPCGSSSQDTDTAAVTVAGSPTGSLTNSTGDISVGCSATLNWTAGNATTGLLTPGDISIPVGDGSGSVIVSPTTTTTYTLSLTGPGGTVEYTASVTVNAAPNITAFSVTPTSIAAGESVTFSATFIGGTGVITPGNYAITSGGTYVLNPGPSSTTTYTLTVTAPCGSSSQATDTATVTIAGSPTGSLTNSTGDISVGCSATLNWTASNATTGLLTPGDISIPVGDGSGSVTVTPTSTTTYTLSLTGPGGTVEYTASVTVNPAPQITTFTALPSQINAGETVTFSATFTGGTGLITPGNYSILSGGTYVLNPGPSSTTAYTLTVTAACGSSSQDTASATVVVGSGPTGSLVSSGDISLGCSATLSWTANNATTGTLTPGDISVPVGDGSGSIIVTPTETTTYTLTLISSEGTTTYNVTVVVNAAPQITEFTALPSQINAGDAITFSATFTGGNGVITPGDYAITSGGTYVLNPGPSSTTVYTLTVTAACGSSSQDTASATVVVGNGPTGSLVSSGDISLGCSATLNWTANNATTGTLTPGDISVPVGDGSGSITVTPTETTIYTLTLTGPDGTTTYNATVTVSPAPSISEFTVSPSSISAGQTVTFRATFSGGTGIITPGDYSITSGGTYVLNPGPSSTTVYTLTVTAACGEASQDTATVTVSVGLNKLTAFKSVEDVNGGNFVPGDEILYSIRIVNGNNEDVRGVEFKDSIPASTSYIIGSAAGPVGCSISFTDNTLDFKDIMVPARGQVLIVFRVVLDNPLTNGVKIISNQGTVEYDSNGDGQNDTDVLTDGDTVTDGDQPTILDIHLGPNFDDTVKTVTLVGDMNNDGIISPGDRVRYRIDIINSGDQDAEGVVFRDTVPVNTDYVVNSVWASFGTPSYNTEANRIEWTGNVVSGGSVTITFDVTVHTGILQRTLISNQGFIDYDSNNDGINDTTLPTDGDLFLPGRQPTDFVVGGMGSIPVIKTVTPIDSVLPVPGDVLQYEVVISNPTGYLLVGLEFIDPIPANTTLVEGSIQIPAGASLVSGSPTIRITGISIPAFTEVKIIFNVRIDSPLSAGVDRIVNQGIVNYDSDGDGTNDSSTLTDWNPALPGTQPTVTIITCPVMEIKIIPGLETVKCGDEIEYVVEYTNISSAPAKNVTITSVYDYKVAFKSSYPPPDLGVDTWTIGTVEPGQTGSIRVRVTVLYRMPFLQIVPHLFVLTSNCDTEQAEAKTNVLGCGPR